MTRDRSPYHFGSPAGAEHFADRREELALLQSRMAGSVNVILHAPRRYGKTSLVRRAASFVEKEGVGVGYVNLLRCSNRREVAQALVGGVLNGPLAHGATARKVASWAERIRIRPRIDVRPDGWAVTFDPGLAERDWAGAMSDACKLLNEKGGRKAMAVILDEFQQVAEIDDGLAGVFKGILDECPDTSWVLAGSHLHMMNRLTTLPGAPLLGMGDVLRLGPVPDEAMRTFLVDRAHAWGKVLREDAAAAICELAGPVPNDIQRLAQHAFDVAEDTIGTSAVETGMRVAVARQEETFAERYERLAPSQQRLLSVLAEGALDRPTSRTVATRIEVTEGAIRKSLRALEDAELVVRRQGRWEVADPFLRRWLGW